MAYMIGLCLKTLFTGKIRTAKPIFILLMSMMGTFSIAAGYLMVQTLGLGPRPWEDYGRMNFLVQFGLLPVALRSRPPSHSNSEPFLASKTSPR